MINFAIKGTQYESLADVLEGPTAVAFSYGDATAAARALDKFVAQYQPLVYKAGVVEGRFYNDQDMVKIGKIPSKEELLSKLLGSLKSPMSSFARVISEMAKKGSGEPEAAPAE